MEDAFTIVIEPDPLVDIASYGPCVCVCVCERVCVCVCVYVREQSAVGRPREVELLLVVEVHEGADLRAMHIHITYVHTEHTRNAHTYYTYTQNTCFGGGKSLFLAGKRVGRGFNGTELQPK